MSTFKDFLLLEEQSSRVREISKEEAVEFARTKCYQYVKNEQWIHRGMDRNEEYLYGDSTQNPTKRVSKDIPNYYTLITDNLPSWKKYPQRSESFIGSTNRSGTTTYGKSFTAIIPDNTKIAILPKRDIWSGFPNIQKTFNGMTADTLATMIKRLHDYIDVDYTSEETQHDWNKLIDFLQKASENIDQIPTKPTFVAETLNKLLTIIREQGVVPTLNYLFEPIYIDLQQANKLNLSDKKYNEVWFAGPAVFIDSKYSLYL